MPKIWKKIKDMSREELSKLKSSYNKKWYNNHKADTYYCKYCKTRYKVHSKSTHKKTMKHKKNRKLYKRKSN